MNAMLDELLQLSRLEHGKQRVDLVSVDPSSALYSAWKSPINFIWGRERPVANHFGVFALP